jgi:hypothetical protein
VKALATAFLALILSSLSSSAAETALSALRALWAADAHNLVRVEARDGLLSPEHWMFTVYDKESRSSLRVLVVAKGEVVTSHDVPPAEAAAQSKELLDSAAVKVDSDEAAERALTYAAANHVKVSAMNFELARQGAKAVPVWIVSCLDQNGAPLGSVVVTASRGNVVASEGFPTAPGAASLVQAMATSRSKPLIQTAAVDPQIMASDREFLKGQVKESTAESIPGLPSAAEPPAPLSDVANAAPPVAIESAPAIAESRENKVSRVQPKAKSTPTPAPKVAGRKRETPDPTIVIGGPDELDREIPPDDAFDRSRGRTDRERLSSEEEAPRKVHIGRFIRRILPF